MIEYFNFLIDFQLILFENLFAEDIFKKTLAVKRILFVGFWLITLAFNSTGQQIWSLERCVEHARQNSLALKQDMIGVERARLSTIRAQHNLYPNLSANVNYRVNFGRTIDPTTNAFETQSIGQSSEGLSTGMVLFNGGAIRNGISQSKINYETSKLDVQQFSDDLALSVVQYYLAILFAEERLDNARIQVQTTTQQLDQIDKLIKAGSKPEGDRLEILAQQAREEQNIITYQNNANSNKLALKQLLRLPSDEDFNISRPNPNALQPSLSQEDINTIFDYATNNRADMKSADLKVKSAELGVKIQKAAYLPTLTIGGNLNSAYSSLGKRITGFKEVKTPLKVDFNGQQAVIDIYNESPITEKNPYFNQFNQNLGYGAGLGLSIPIYSNYLAKSNVKNAELNVESAKLTSEQNKQALKNNIQTALNDYESAKNSYEASKRTSAAQQLAYNNTKTKFDLGSANTFELVSSKNRLDMALVEEVLARYDLIFRSKVIDYYMGRSITLN